MARYSNRTPRPGRLLWQSIFATQQRFPRGLPEPREKEILQRTKAHVLAAYLESDAAPSKAPLQPWIWLGSGGFAFVAVALFLLWPSAPTLRIHGLQKVQSHELNSSATRGGKVSVPGKWRVYVGNASSVSFSSPTKQRQHLELKSGLIRVAVQPRTMKQFVVQAGSARVVVKGTRFSVERHKRWIRVEVWRGKVELQAASARRPIAKGQGCRLDLQGQTTRCYPLPPAQMEPIERIQWLAKYAPKQLFLFARDLSANPRYSLSQRARFLRETSDLLRAAGRSKEAITSYQLLAQLQTSDHDEALVNAALLCRKVYLKNPALCQSIFRRCLGQCKSPTWREQSHGILALSLYQNAKTEEQRRQSLLAIHGYLQLYPKGTWQKNLRRLLVRQAIVDGKSCAFARKLLAANDPGEAWFIKRCKR